ncbi:FGGY-family carbohydrate kinase [Aestuariibius insulae]|uniref:FGGY-family carbohydrate kinase n=1 Tax=Aestuariibius insulae TaxID=2058287 RepID=UPI00345EF8CB
MADRLTLGIDVGTGSARAGLFDGAGRLAGHGAHPIHLWQDGELAEQSSADIWLAVCRATAGALEAAEAKAEDVAGIGFDATCSMAVLSSDGSPVTVSRSGHPARDVIVWMDHRAIDQARRINETDHPVLRYVGGRISPEMQTPKLLWLKENMPQSYAGAGHFMDLPDWLTWRATASTARSICTVTCKWTYLAHEHRWDSSYFREIGLEDLAEAPARIGTEIVPLGTPLGSGLSPEAAADLGLIRGIPVAASLIDAHAGGIGTLGAADGPGEATSRMAYVFGTSACTMTSTQDPTFVPGVWGPYHSAMIPGLWLNEGGQSAAGAAIAQLLAMHPASARAETNGQSLPHALAEEAAAMGDAFAVAGEITVVPDFNGNRSPHADPGARAVIAGLGARTDHGSLIALYAAGLLGLGYGLRQILEAQRNAGIDTEAIVVSGGAGAHPFVRQTLADATGLPILLPETPEPVLLGSAMLGAVAAGIHADIPVAMRAMSRNAARLSPDPARTDAHTARFRRFAALQAASGL